MANTPKTSIYFILNIFPGASTPLEGLFTGCWTLAAWIWIRAFIELLESCWCINIPCPDASGYILYIIHGWSYKFGFLFQRQHLKVIPAHRVQLHLQSSSSSPSSCGLPDSTQASRWPWHLFSLGSRVITQTFKCTVQSSPWQWTTKCNLC